MRELVSGPLARYLPGIPLAEALLSWLNQLHRARLLVQATRLRLRQAPGLG